MDSEDKVERSSEQQVEVQKQPQVISPVQSRRQSNQLDENKKKIIIRNQIFVFVLTFLAYAAIHATRTAWSSSKQSLKEDLDEKDDHFLGLVDTSFLLCYAISMKVLGAYSSRFQIQYFLGFGMISASVCLLVIYFICQVSINKGFLLFMMMVNGVSQSSGWPSVVACMGNWFGNGKKGLLMGLWGTNGNVGNMIGYFVQDLAVNTLDLNWKFVLFIIGIFLLIIGSIVIFNLEPYPQKLGISQQDLDAFQQMQQLNGSSFVVQQKNGHVELDDEYEIEEKRNQTVRIEIPNYKYTSFRDDDLEMKQKEDIKENLQNDEDKIQSYDVNKQNKDDQQNNIQITDTNSKEKMATNSPISQPQEKTINSKNEESSSQNQPKSDNYELNNDEINSDSMNKNSIKANLGNDLEISSTNVDSQKQNVYQPDSQAATNSQIVGSPEEKKDDQLTLFNAWVKVPGLTIFALTQGGCKGTIYGLMFWLPIYLQEHGLKSQAAFICSMNEIGTFAGGLLLGMLIDKLKMKAAIITLFIGISSIIMFVIHFLPSGVALPYYFFVLLGGICLGGPYTMLGGAIAIELSQQPEVKHYKNVTALLAGIIEGFGSFVAAFVQIIVPFFGQKYIFLLFSFSTFFSTLFLMKKAIAEVKASPLFNK